MIQRTKKFLAIGTAAAILATATTASVAAPIGIGSGPLSIHNGEASDVIQVSRRGRRNTAIAVGAGALLLGGAIAAGSAYPYYGPGYGYYAAPPPPQQQCWVQTGPYRGQGYYAYC